MELDAVYQAILRGTIPQSLIAVREWLSSAAPGALEQAIRQCPCKARSRFIALLRDVMSGYPNTLIGVPMLIFWMPDDAASCGQLRLPRPAGEDVEPCAELFFRGWLPADAALPMSQPYQPQPVYVPGGHISAVVALFSYQPLKGLGEFDLEELDVPGLWWANLLFGAPGEIHISSRVLLPYPDAVEAAQSLLVVARQQDQPPALLLSPAAKSFIAEAGAAFRGRCQAHFPDQVG